MFLNPFDILQVALALLIIFCILLQQRAVGLTSGAMNTMVVQRRGAEKLLYQATGILMIAFSALTILRWFV